MGEYEHVSPDRSIKLQDRESVKKFVMELQNKETAQEASAAEKETNDRAAREMKKKKAHTHTHTHTHTYIHSCVNV
jgi:ABC-type Zn2+ transport system substrate-binding protein/surface adhesin